MNGAARVPSRFDRSPVLANSRQSTSDQRWPALVRPGRAGVAPVRIISATVQTTHPSPAKESQADPSRSDATLNLRGEIISGFVTILVL